MNKLLTLIFISISVACLGQVPKEQPKEVLKDSVLIIPQWITQQIEANNAEIKRLGGTTIEAEQQRLLKENQLMVNSCVASKVADVTRIEKINPPTEGKIIVTLKPIKK